MFIDAIEDIFSLIEEVVETELHFISGFIFIIFDL